jgi:hypothetical protein
MLLLADWLPSVAALASVAAILLVSGAGCGLGRPQPCCIPPAAKFWLLKSFLFGLSIL